jgi:hypothetical protein
MSRWTPAEDALLRERYGKVRTRDLAAELGRTHLATKQKAMKLGLCARRAHAAEEITVVRELYPQHTAAEIAERLYGTAERVNRVIKIVEKLGLRKWCYWPQEVLDRVRALHAEGLLDRQIAGLMADTFQSGDEGRGQVRQIRDRLGLPANRRSSHAVAARRRGLTEQLRTLGLENPNDLRKRAHRQFAERYGLPPDLRPVQVRMILALVNGPLTLAELKEAIGARPESGLLHNESGTSYQANLIRRGLVASIPTGIAGAVKGPRVRYMLTAACLDLLAANQEVQSR